MRSFALGFVRFGTIGARATTAEINATMRGIPGHRFGRFGRRLGLRLMCAGALRAGASLLVTPVNCVRYWEFDFAERYLPNHAGRGLDVSSPRLLSVFLGHSRRFQSITMANPDPADLAETLRMIRSLGVAGIDAIEADAVEASRHVGRVAAAWSISVLEHVGGTTGDADAVRAMWDALEPGGIMVLTVPVDRRAWDEFRETDTYGLAVEEGGRYFFQRYYDLATLRTRLIDTIRTEPFAIEWFGERRAGTFRRYESDWMQRGHEVTASDPAFIAREFRAFRSWEEMPGMGVCGMAFRRPVDEI